MALFVRFIRIVDCWEKAIFQSPSPLHPLTRVTETSDAFPRSLKSVLTIPDFDISNIQCGAGSSQTVLTSLLPIAEISGDPKSESNTQPENSIADTETPEHPPSTECDTLKLRLDELTEENRKLISQVSIANKGIAYMYLQVRGRTSARDALKKQNADLQQDLLQLNEVKENLDCKLRDAEEQHRKESHEQQAKMEAQMKEVQNQIKLKHQSQLQSELTKFQVERGIYERRISFLETQASNLQHRVSSYQEELVETKAKFDDCLANLSDLQQSNCHLNDLLQQQQTAYEEAYQELAECEETIEKMWVFYAVMMETKDKQIQKLQLQVDEIAARAEVSPNYYKLLGVNRQTSQTDLRKAYYKKALEHHPDRVTHPADREKREASFKLMKRAYDMLSHTKLKNEYDDWFDQKTLNSSYQRVYCDRN
jgi:chromosome segregation ATPase